VVSCKDGGGAIATPPPDDEDFLTTGSSSSSSPLLIRPANPDVGALSRSRDLMSRSSLALRFFSASSNSISIPRLSLLSLVNLS